jgi:hypothetical protein
MHKGSQSTRVFARAPIYTTNQIGNLWLKETNPHTSLYPSSSCASLVIYNPAKYKSAREQRGFEDRNYFDKGVENERS